MLALLSVELYTSGSTRPANNLVVIIFGFPHFNSLFVYIYGFLQCAAILLKTETAQFRLTGFTFFPIICLLLRAV